MYATENPFSDPPWGFGHGEGRRIGTGGRSRLGGKFLPMTTFFVELGATGGSNFRRKSSFGTGRLGGV